MRFIAAELDLPVNCCKRCGISFLPDYRTGKRQIYCPYGCVEANRRENKQRAKRRYRKRFKARILASKQNCLYRQRKKNGQVVSVTVQVNEKKEKEVIGRKLKAQIKFFYYSLYPETPAEKIEQLDRILEKLSQKMAAKYS